MHRPRTAHRKSLEICQQELPLALDTIILKYLVEIQYKIGYYVPASKA